MSLTATWSPCRKVKKDPPVNIIGTDLPKRRSVPFLGEFYFENRGLLFSEKYGILIRMKKTKGAY